MLVWLVKDRQITKNPAPQLIPCRVFHSRKKPTCILCFAWYHHLPLRSNKICILFFCRKTKSIQHFSVQMFLLFLDFPSPSFHEDPEHEAVAVQSRPWSQGRSPSVTCGTARSSRTSSEMSGVASTEASKRVYKNKGTMVCAFFHGDTIKISFYPLNTVDGRNPAPPGMCKTL